MLQNPNGVLKAVLLPEFKQRNGKDYLLPGALHVYRERSSKVKPNPYRKADEYDFTFVYFIVFLKFISLFVR